MLLLWGTIQQNSPSLLLQAQKLVWCKGSGQVSNRLEGEKTPPGKTAATWKLPPQYVCAGDWWRRLDSHSAPISWGSLYADDFLPCQYCLGFIRWHDLWKHVASCQFKPAYKQAVKYEKVQMNAKMMIMPTNTKEENSVLNQKWLHRWRKMSSHLS